MPKVLNKHKDTIPADAVYIGRPSKWGNPFVLEKGGDREAIYKQYCEWLDQNEELKKQAQVELKGKDLVCYCAPLRCHGDALIQIANGSSKITEFWDKIVEKAKPKPTTVTVQMLTNPMDDGIDHINMYSKGRTKLGRDLTHFAPIGFTHPEYGKFGSVEAFWYWASTGKRWDHLRPLIGFKAKEEGKKLEVIKYPTFMNEVEEANRLKILQNPELLEAFKNSTLPLTHYYAYGNAPDMKAVSHWSTPWFEYFFTKLRKELRGELEKGYRVLVAGSRTIQDFELVKRTIEESGYHIKELVSGVANGPDRLGLRYANQRNIPVKEFPADWEQYGNRAGMIRNGLMAEYADILIAIWDGESVGTLDMINRMKKLGKPVYLVTVPRLATETPHA